MQFQVTINLDNAAFLNDENGDVSYSPEVVRILRDLADKVESFDDVSDFERVLYDVNGNRVGKATVTA